MYYGRSTSAATGGAGPGVPFFLPVQRRPPSSLLRRTSAATKVILTLALGGIGVLYLSNSLGLVDIPAPLAFSAVTGVDKWEAGSVLLGVSSAHLKLFVGSCKFSAAIAFWTNGVFGLEQLATFMAALLYACVTVAHVQIDGDVVGPLVLVALCVAKFFTKPGAAKPKLNAH